MICDSEDLRPGTPARISSANARSAQATWALPRNHVHLLNGSPHDSREKCDGVITPSINEQGLFRCNTAEPVRALLRDGEPITAFTLNPLHYLTNGRIHSTENFAKAILLVRKDD
jgi:hypothetical protein